jgi:hypothetical protein
LLINFLLYAHHRRLRFYFALLCLGCKTVRLGLGDNLLRVYSLFLWKYSRFAIGNALFLVFRLVNISRIEINTVIPSTNPYKLSSSFINSVLFNVMCSKIKDKNVCTFLYIIGILNSHKSGKIIDPRNENISVWTEQVINVLGFPSFGKFDIENVFSFGFF